MGATPDREMVRRVAGCASVPAYPDPSAGSQHRNWEAEGGAQFVLSDCTPSTAAGGGCHGKSALLAEAELLDGFKVVVAVGPLQVSQQAVATTHHRQKSATRMMVVLVPSEVLLKALDPIRQDGDLDFRRSGVRVVSSMVFSNFGLASDGNTHVILRSRRLGGRLDRRLMWCDSFLESEIVTFPRESSTPRPEFDPVCLALEAVS